MVIFSMNFYNGYQRNRIIKTFILLITALFLLAFIIKIHPFLAQSSPVEGEILLVEGWTVNIGFVLPEALKEFNKGTYRCVITIGQSFENNRTIDGCSSYAELAMQELIRLGLDSGSVISVSSPFTKRHKTYTSAVAFKNWISCNNKTIKSLNIMSVGAHSRYTFTLFKRVLGPSIKIGIISVKQQRYNPQFWFFSINGIKYTLLDIIGYVYSLLWIF